MRGLFLSFGLGVALSLSMFGCATGGVTVYSGASTGRISNVMYGQIIQADNVVLSDTGLGTVAGGVLGGVAGHQFGKGRGKTAMTIAGGVLGAAAGNQLAQSDGQSLVVRLDSGGEITFTQKGRQYRVGDRVALTVQGNEVTQVRFATR